MFWTCWEYTFSSQSSLLDLRLAPSRFSPQLLVRNQSLRTYSPLHLSRPPLPPLQGGGSWRWWPPEWFLSGSVLGEWSSAGGAFRLAWSATYNWYRHTHTHVLYMYIIYIYNIYCVYNIIYCRREAILRECTCTLYVGVYRTCSSVVCTCTM